MNGRAVLAVCECFGTLTRVLPRTDLESGLAARLPGARVEFFPGLCQPRSLDRLAVLLAREQAGTCVLCACSPLARGQEALDGLQARGCGQNLVLADLREGCAFIHRERPAEALAKALDLAAMALARAGHAAASPRDPLPAEGRVLVIGAGPAGMAAAGTLAGLGLPVTLVERQDQPGGLPRQIARLFPDNAPSGEFLAPLEEALRSPLVEFAARTTVTALSGDPGSFTARLKGPEGEREVQAGAVVLACGAMPVLPEGRYRSKEVSGVISQLELETRLKAAEADPASWTAPEAVFIQCLGARDAEHPYCSTICCPTALKNALRLKDLAPEKPVTILQRGIMTPGRELEDLYRRALAAGVRVAAYRAENPPEVQGQGQVSGVCLRDPLSGRDLSLRADLVVLSTPLKPQPALAKLAEMLHLRLDGLGFACGREPVEPLSPALPGVFLCGAARWPVTVAQAADQGRAAGIKAAAFLAAGSLDPAGLGLPGPWPGASSVRPERCSRCGRCVAACPYGACQRQADGAVAVARARCRGCGVCAAVCPSGAAAIPETDAQSLRAMLRQAAGARPFAQPCPGARP